MDRERLAGIGHCIVRFHSEERWPNPLSRPLSGATVRIYPVRLVSSAPNRTPLRVALAKAVLPWRKRPCLGESGLALAKAVLLWRKRSCFGESGPALAKAVLLWRKRSCFGESGPALAKAVLLWQKRSCFGESGLALAKAVLLW